jgi:hypothetical protein
MNYYRYLDTDNNGIIEIKALRRPNIQSRPRSGTWIVREWTRRGWQIPNFPEITWGRLSKLIYLGSEKLK